MKSQKVATCGDSTAERNIILNIVCIFDKNDIFLGNRAG
jgi:hypothetical protein